jgi:hypothetical protein
MKVRIETITPNLPMSDATPSNFYYNGVGGFSVFNNIFNFPETVFYPTKYINYFTC